MANNEQKAQLRREECRRDVMGFLAARQVLAFHPNTICRTLNEGHERDYAVAEIEAAVAFLGSLEPIAVKVVHDALGATQYFQATAAGVLLHERG
jgi:hypothetical protein